LVTGQRRADDKALGNGGHELSLDILSLPHSPKGLRNILEVARWIGDNSFSWHFFVSHHLLRSRETF
jgi:hypothetical protein